MLRDSTIHSSTPHSDETQPAAARRHRKDSGTLTTFTTHFHFSDVSLRPAPCHHAAIVAIAVATMVHAGRADAAVNRAWPYGSYVEAGAGAPGPTRSSRPALDIVCDRTIPVISMKACTHSAGRERQRKSVKPIYGSLPHERSVVDPRDDPLPAARTGASMTSRATLRLRPDLLTDPRHPASSPARSVSRRSGARGQRGRTGPVPIPSRRGVRPCARGSRGGWAGEPAGRSSAGHTSTTGCRPG
jgi:hypothetical protein